ncbi:MAG: glycosyltransferase family protein [Planctomycetota bacterium]|jgi:hypothetical protein
MSALDVVAYAVGAVALVRGVVGLAFLHDFIKGAALKSIPKGPTPPFSVIVAARGDEPSLEENLRATLRQNYPQFELLLVQPEDEPVEAPEGVADVEIRSVSGDPFREAQYESRLVSDPRARPDPLYLRDAANGLQVASEVVFVPVLFGMRSVWSRVVALVVNTELVPGMLMARGNAAAPTTRAIRGAGGRAVLARRAVRLFCPRGRLRDAAPAFRPTALPTSFAPPLLLLVGGWGLLAVLLLLRLLVAFAVDFRFCWDRSLIRSLPLLPLLWILEPLGWLTGLFLLGRRATLKGS